MPEDNINIIKVLSFQGEDVMRTLMRDGVYTPEKELMRERREYDEDKKQLGGKLPIWCFTPRNNKTFNIDELHSGDFFSVAKCEMSLQQFKDLGKFDLLEIEIPVEKLFLGLTHNAYSLAKVFSELKIEMVKAVYKLDYSYNWYMPAIIVKESLSSDILIKEDYFSKAIKKYIETGVYDIEE